MTRWRLAQSARKCSARKAKSGRGHAVATPPSFSGCARDGSARARRRRVNADSVVDYMYIMLCFPVLTVGLLLVNPIEVYYGK